MQQHPRHNPSKNLSANELQCLYDILGKNCVTLGTAVAKISHDSDGTWIEQACGVFCFVKDYHNRSYYFRLYDLKLGNAIYEERAPSSLHLVKVSDAFYTFDGSNCKIGINFDDDDEAQTFSHHFHAKQADRQKKKKTNVPTTIVSQPSPSLATTTVDTLKKSNVAKNSDFSRIGPNKKIPVRPYISAPIQSTLVHVSHIGTNEIFFNNDAKRQMFENVLAGMHISEEEKSYVREIVKTDVGLQKLLGEPVAPTHDANNQGQRQISSGAPEIPSRSYKTIGRNSPTVPPLSLIELQEGSVMDSNQVKARRAPPSPPPSPPMPANLMNQNQSSGGALTLRPPPPPPSSMNPIISRGPVTDSSSVPASSSVNENLLDDASSFDISGLKQRLERLALREVSPTDDTNSEAQDKMAIRISQILDERQEKLSEPEVQDNSYSSDDVLSN
ncbi:unnamed protein product [Rotaria sp. Silwood1]|nr:unnamed protein product [Rotaria sp. Silwood1]CAF1656686.1 unnamed protein product [Rotaria sp. Silwood1]